MILGLAVPAALAQDPCPAALDLPITDPEQIAHLDVRRRDRFGGILYEYRLSVTPVCRSLLFMRLSFYRR
jgi:hypothetical protein